MARTRTFADVFNGGIARGGGSGEDVAASGVDVPIPKSHELTVKLVPEWITLTRICWKGN